MNARLLLLALSLPVAGICAPTALDLANGTAETPIASTVTAPAVPLTRDVLIADLSRELASHFNLEGDLELGLIRPWSPPTQVAANWTVNVVEYPSIASSSMLVRCRVTADGALVAEPTFILRAELWRDAWAARAPLTFGAMFDSTELEARRVDMFRERDALPAAVGDRTYIFARGVDAGRLLTWRDIARRPLVKRGEMVDVTAMEGMLVVTMKGLAMENGAQGDTVTVRNPESRKDFAATVIDENRVQVRF